MQWCVDPLNDHMWQETDHGWTQFQPTPLLGRSCYRCTTTMTSQPITPLEHTTATTHGFGLVHHMGYVNGYQPLLPPTTLDHRIQQLGPHSWPMRTAWFPEEGAQIAEAIT